MTIPRGCVGVSYRERHRWVVAVAIPSGRPDLRELAEALCSLPGRRVVRAEAWVDDDAVREAA